MEIDDESAEDRAARFERLVEQFQATQKRQLIEYAQKVWLRMERCRVRIRRDHKSTPKFH
jgi:hypothetical protein